MQPRVLVGCPTSDYKSYCLDKYIDAVKNLTYKNYDILLVDNSKDDNYKKKIESEGIKAIKSDYSEKVRDRIINSRNILRDYFLNNNYDYLFSLEQDVIPPSNVIETLLSHNKKIISGVYFNRQVLEKKSGEKIRMMVPVLFIESEENPGRMRWLLPEIVEKPRLMKVFACGLGCVLINKDVLEKVKFRYVKEESGFDDVWFSQDVRENKFEIFADTSIKCEHLILDKDYDWSDLK